MAAHVAARSSPPLFAGASVKRPGTAVAMARTPTFPPAFRGGLIEAP